MKYKRGKLKDTVGTSKKGEIRTNLAVYNRIVDLFGEPYIYSDLAFRHGSPQVEWVIKFDDGTIANIYDRIEVNPKKNKEWTIGGNSEKALYYIVALVLKHYRSLIKRAFGDHK